MFEKDVMNDYEVSEFDPHRIDDIQILRVNKGAEESKGGGLAV